MGASPVLIEKLFPAQFTITIYLPAPSVAFQQTTLPYAVANLGAITRGTRALVPVMQDGADGPVVAEVGVADRARRVDLRAGRYFVRGRGRDHLLEGVITVAAGELHPVRDGELKRLEYARLVRKGGSSLRRVQGPQAGYRIRSGVTSGSSPCQGAFAGYAVEMRRLSITPRFSYCRSSLQNDTLSSTVDAFDAELALAHAFDVRYVSFEFGVSTGAALFHQRFVTQGTSPPRITAAFQISATFGLTTDLPRGFYLFGLVAGETYFLNQVARNGSSSFGPAFTVAGSVGLGRRF